MINILFQRRFAETSIPGSHEFNSFLFNVTGEDFGLVGLDAIIFVAVWDLLFVLDIWGPHCFLIVLCAMVPSIDPCLHGAPIHPARYKYYKYDLETLEEMILIDFKNCWLWSLLWA